MKENDFRSFLMEQGKNIDKYYISGKVLGLNAVNEIIKWTKGVEKNFEVDLDVVVVNPELTEKLLKAVEISNKIFENKKKLYSKAVKAYYEFKNGYQLP